MSQRTTPSSFVAASIGNTGLNATELSSPTDTVYVSGIGRDQVSVATMVGCSFRQIINDKVLSNVANSGQLPANDAPRRVGVSRVAMHFHVRVDQSCVPCPTLFVASRPPSWDQATRDTLSRSLGS